MKDAIGQDLEVNDVVTYMDVTGVHPGVRLGRVIKFTPQFIEIRDLRANSTQPGYVPWHMGTRKKPPFVTRVSDSMRHLEDGEIFLHFNRLQREA